MGDRGGTATDLATESLCPSLYPMGDRGGTATTPTPTPTPTDYTRWEIGGEPQLSAGVYPYGFDYTRWEIGGEPQPIPCASPH